MSFNKISGDPIYSAFKKQIGIYFLVTFRILLLEVLEFILLMHIFEWNGLKKWCLHFVK